MSGGAYAIRGGFWPAFAAQQSIVPLKLTYRSTHEILEC